MTGSHASLLDPGSLVLLATRLRSRGTIDDVLSTISQLSGRELLTDSDPLHFRSAVTEMLNDGLIRSRGEIGRLSLTNIGAERLHRAMSDSTARVGPERVEDTYREFLAVNHDFLLVVSTWQSEPDARDAAAGVKVFRSLVGRVNPAVADLSQVLPRFSCYTPRFEAALEQSVDRREWIESPLIASVHTVWFELHEHLLASLGLERTGER